SRICCATARRARIAPAEPRRRSTDLRAAIAKFAPRVLCEAMAKRKRYLTATMPDGYVKTIGPTAAALTHYWRIVAVTEDGRTEVFWGHAKSLREA
ncbi:hypothetical protein, partial [Enterococcus faecium]|uniref:hypothetical protein n=1 Tax=Enterococcus faecium TaxID=1352 RepID=UPI003F427DDD